MDYVGMYDFRTARILDMTRDQALALLGFRAGDSPSVAQLKAAQRQKALEAHPDRGGSSQQMQDINRAFDYLTKGGGNPRQPEPSAGGWGGTSYGYGGGYGGGASYSDPGAHSGYEPPPKAEDVEVTFEEAFGKAGVPAGVDWLFTTDMQRAADNYSSDESQKSDYGFVAYGRTATQHVFLGVRTYVHRYYVIGMAFGNRDITTVKCKEVPIKGTEGADPAWIYRHIVTALKETGFEGRFNSRVFDAPNWKPGPSPARGGTKTTVKNWLVNSGQIADDSPAVANRKNTVEMFIDTTYPIDGAQPKPDYHAVDPYSKTYLYKLQLILNGRVVTLNERDAGLFIGKRIVRHVFKDSTYEVKKNLLRIKNGKKVIEWLAANLTGISQRDREILTAAAAQLK